MAAPDLDLTLPWRRIPPAIAREIFEMARMTPTPSCVAIRGAFEIITPAPVSGCGAFGICVRLRRHTCYRDEQVNYILRATWIIPPGLGINPPGWGSGWRPALRPRVNQCDGIELYYREVSFDGGMYWIRSHSDNGILIRPKTQERLDGDYYAWPLSWPRL